MQKFINYLFKDRHGKIVIWQAPNVPLWGFIVFRLLAVVVKHGKLHAGFSSIGTAFIFLWAYLEITSGESKFRRALGVIVMALTVSSFMA